MIRVRQVIIFAATGLAAAVAHYGLMIVLVERARWMPLPATLSGYLAGGVVSYLLNRRFTFASARAHRDGAWRFAIVAGVGFGLTALSMAVLVNGAGLPYVPAQIATTGVVLIWSFAAHRIWTFGVPAPP